MQSIIKFFKELFKEHKIIQPTILFIVGIWGAFFIIVPFLVWYFKSITLVNFGVFGDSFNVMTSLFTGLALIGVIISIYLQKRELELQRGELKNQNKQLELQRQEMAHQNFNTQFFQMLNVFNTIVANLGINNPDDGKTEKLKFTLLKKCESYLGYSPQNSADFDGFDSQDYDVFKPYFITLYQIIKYTHKNIPKEEEAKIYTNIIRAQLSPDDLIFLLYNAIAVIPFSGKKYKELLEEYAFFEHLSVDSIHDNGYANLNNDILKQYDSKIAGENKRLKEKIERLRRLS